MKSSAWEVFKYSKIEELSSGELRFHFQSERRPYAGGKKPYYKNWTSPVSGVVHRRLLDGWRTDNRGNQYNDCFFALPVVVYRDGTITTN